MIEIREVKNFSEYKSEVIRLKSLEPEKNFSDIAYEISVHFYDDSARRKIHAALLREVNKHLSMEARFSEGKKDPELEAASILDYDGFCKALVKQQRRHPDLELMEIMSELESHFYDEETKKSVKERLRADSGNYSGIENEKTRLDQVLIDIWNSNNQCLYDLNDFRFKLIEGKLYYPKKKMTEIEKWVLGKYRFYKKDDGDTSVADEVERAVGAVLDENPGIASADAALEKICATASNNEKELIQFCAEYPAALDKTLGEIYAARPRFDVFRILGLVSAAYLLLGILRSLGMLRYDVSFALLLGLALSALAAAFLLAGSLDFGNRRGKIPKWAVAFLVVIAVPAVRALVLNSMYFGPAEQNAGIIIRLAAILVGIISSIKQIWNCSHRNET